MEENYMISKAISHPRTFHLEKVLFRMGHPQGHFRESESMHVFTGNFTVEHS